jgi:hypothetical protein
VYEVQPVTVTHASPNVVGTGTENEAAAGLAFIGQLTLLWRHVPWVVFAIVVNAAKWVVAPHFFPSKALFTIAFRRLVSNLSASSSVIRYGLRPSAKPMSQGLAQPGT